MRKNQYNLHIRLDEDERAALEKGLQASSALSPTLTRRACSCVTGILMV